jgi:hypothetical protein
MWTPTNLHNHGKTFLWRPFPVCSSEVFSIQVLFKHDVCCSLGDLSESACTLQTTMELLCKVLVDAGIGVILSSLLPPLCVQESG